MSGWAIYDSGYRRPAKSSLIDVGFDGIGRCRLCSYAYRAADPPIYKTVGRSSWQIPDDPMPPVLPAASNRAARRRNR